MTDLTVRPILSDLTPPAVEEPMPPKADDPARVRKAAAAQLAQATEDRS